LSGLQNKHNPRLADRLGAELYSVAWKIEYWQWTLEGLYFSRQTQNKTFRGSIVFRVNHTD